MLWSDIREKPCRKNTGSLVESVKVVPTGSLHTNEWIIYSTVTRFWQPPRPTVKWFLTPLPINNEDWWGPPTFGVMIVVGLLPKKGWCTETWQPIRIFWKIPCQCLYWVFNFMLALDFDNNEGPPSSLFPHVFLSAKTRKSKNMSFFHTVLHREMAWLKSLLTFSSWWFLPWPLLYSPTGWAPTKYWLRIPPNPNHERHWSSKICKSSLHSPKEKACKRKSSLLRTFM